MGSALLYAGLGAGITLLLIALAVVVAGAARRRRRPRPPEHAAAAAGGAGGEALGAPQPTPAGPEPPLPPPGPAPPSWPTPPPTPPPRPSAEAGEPPPAAQLALPGVPAPPPVETSTEPQELPPVVRAIWESLVRGEAMLLPTAAVKEQKGHLLVLALAAAHERWNPDGTRTPCQLGVEELIEIHPRTPANLQRGQLGIHVDTIIKILADLRRGYLRFVPVPESATNARGQGFATLLPCDPGQRALPLAEAEHAAPERPLRRPRLSGPRHRSVDRQSGEAGSVDREPAIQGSVDPAPPAPPVRKSVPSGSDPSDLPTSTTARSPDAGAGAVGPPEEADREGGTVVELPAWPKGCCFQCWTPHLEVPEGEKTPCARVPALGMHGPKPPALDGMPLTEKQLRSYCGACLVRAAGRMRLQYGDTFEGVKNVAATVDRFLHDERQGRPWVVKRPRVSGSAPAPASATATSAPLSAAAEPGELDLGPEPTPAAAATWERAFPVVCEGQRPQEVELWLRPLRCLSTDGGGVRLWAPNLFIASWVRDHYEPRILDALAAVLGERPTLTWEHGPTTQEGGHEAAS